MGIGTGIFLIALGAILKWGVSDHVNGINLSAIGVILMIVGLIGLIISLLYANIWSRRRTTAADEPVVREREYRSY